MHSFLTNEEERAALEAALDPSSTSAAQRAKDRIEAEVHRYNHVGGITFNELSPEARAVIEAQRARAQAKRDHERQQEKTRQDATEQALKDSITQRDVRLAERARLESDPQLLAAEIKKRCDTSSLRSHDPMLDARINALRHDVDLVMKWILATTSRQ